MQYTVEHAEYGKIVYEESVWLGKRSVYLNGTPMTRVNKKTFSCGEGETRVEITVSGNNFSGVRLTLNNGDVLTVIPPCKWYEIVITAITFVFFVIWGNMTALVKIVPLVGGMIGGAIGGLFAALGLVCMRSVKRPGWKILLGLAAFACAFLLNYLIGAAILGAAGL